MEDIRMKTLNKLYVKATVVVFKMAEKAENKLKEKNGNFLEEALKYILAIVIGALFLGGIYLLFKNIIIPTVGTKVQELFNYSA